MKYKITFYYNDGSAYEKHFKSLLDATAIECGILRGLYAIALDDPKKFKEHFVVGYKLEDNKGMLLDSYIYRKVERV